MVVAAGLGPSRPLARAGRVRSARRRRPRRPHVAAQVLGAIRRAKTTEKRSMRAQVARLVVTAPAQTLAAVEAARGDLTDAGGVEELELVDGDALTVEVVLAEEA